VGGRSAAALTTESARKTLITCHVRSTMSIVTKK